MRKYIEQHPYLTIIVSWLCIFIPHLQLLYPNIMEARNFVTAREMLVDENWLLTTMNGLPRYQKPPLPTWLSAASGEVFGMDSLFALRLPAALITLLLLLVVYSLSRKLTRNNLYALLSSLIAATSFYIIFSGRNGTWDIFAHAFMATGIYFLFQLFEEEGKSIATGAWAGLFIGLSFMSKGPVSHYALLLPFLLAYGTVYKFSRVKTKWLSLLLLLLIVSVLSSWWAVYIYYMDPAEATRIAQVESGRWIGYELKPFYYYWSFFTQSGLWTIPAFIALLYPYLKSRVSNLKAYRFVVLWTVFAVLLLSFIPTKKSRYLLPVLIPLALTTSFYITYLYNNFKTLSNRWELWPVYFNYGLIACIGIIFPIGGYLFFGQQLEGLWTSFISTSIALCAAGLGIIMALRNKNFPRVFYTSILFIMIVITLGFPLSQLLLGNNNYKSLSNLHNATIPIVAIDDLSPELIWEYGKPTPFATLQELVNLKKGTTIGVLTSYSKAQDKLKPIISKFDVIKKETYDINPVDSTQGSYKDRLKASYYVMRKR